METRALPPIQGTGGNIYFKDTRTWGGAYHGRGAWCLVWFCDGTAKKADRYRFKTLKELRQFCSAFNIEAARQ
jgi:hypothetical protein